MKLKALQLASVSLVFLATAHAQDLPNQPSPTSQSLGRPLSFRIGQEILVDSNVLRLPAGQAVPLFYGGNQRSDVISRTFGGITYSNIVANQNLRLDLSAEIRQYSHFSSLNRDSYGLSAGVGGDINRAWYYLIDLSASSLAGDFINQLGLEPNALRNLGLSGRIGYRFTPSWSTYLSLSDSRRTNSALTLITSDTSQNSTEVGLRFEPESAISAEIGLAHRNVSYPNRQRFDAFGNPLPLTVSNSFHSDQLIGRITYRPTSQSSFSGNIGIGATRFDELTQRNASSFLFGFNYRWVFSDLAEVGAQFSRDLASDAVSFSSPVLTTRLGADAIWKPTGRLSVTGQINTSTRRFTADPGLSVGNNGLVGDKFLSVGILTQYEISRAIRLNAGINHQSRSADIKAFSSSTNIFNIGMTVNLD
jgi:hypothetical protein